MTHDNAITCSVLGFFCKDIGSDSLSMRKHKFVRETCI